MKNFKIAASIVAYKNDELQLANAINSFLNTEDDLILYLIDNSPTDELKEICLDERVKYFHNPSNPGFGAAHNIAIRKAIQENAKYHFIINPDICFIHGTIENIVKHMDQHLDVGLLMPQIRYPDGAIQYLPKLLPSPFDLLVRRFSLIRNVFSKRLEEYELRKTNNKKVFNVPIITGCFSCFRIEALIRVGLYDEDFFMYFEDFDISRRMNKYYETIYYSDVYVFHEYERGAQKSSKLFKIFILSAFKYFNKWGWVFDKERKRINKKTLAQFN